MPRTFEEAVLAKLDQLLRVHTISVTKGMKQNEQIALLNRAGLPPKEIADLLGTTPNTVSVRLAGLRKSKPKNGKASRQR
jgi:DNA-binding CsgD family transcriptional regulator